jgi:hypothetical protein
VAAALIPVVLALLLAAGDPGDSLVLDREGQQGTVAFDHAVHVRAPRDPASPFPAPATAACGGCHHTNDGKGVIQLAKCEGCHGPEGDPRNPQSRAFDEENRKTAFHEMCIGCHANLAKAAAGSTSNARTGPVDCADCHKTNARAANR